MPRRPGEWLLVLNTLLVLAFLVARARTAPVEAFREHQSLPGAPAPLREGPQWYPRIHAEVDGTLARPGGLTLEWRGFVHANRAGELAVLAEAAGPTTVTVDGREVLRFDGTPPGRPRTGTADVAAGPVELGLRTELPADGAWFRGALRLPGGELVRLEDADVALTARGARTDAGAGRALDGVLAILALAAMLGIGRAVAASSPRERRLGRVAFAGLFLAFALLVPHGPGLRHWGTAWLGWGDPSARAAVLLLGCVPWLVASGPGAGRLARWHPPFPASPALRTVAVAASALALTWLLRERRIWGDGWITIAMLEGRAPIGPFGEFFWKEPLDRLLAVLATRVAGAFGGGAREGVAFSSCAAGAVLAAGIHAARSRGTIPGAAAALLATAGGLVVFFGHVENYAWVTAATALFLFAALRLARDGEGALATGALAGLALALHPVGVFEVAPAMLVLLVVARGGRGRLVAGAVAGPAALVAGCAAAGIALPPLGPNRFADDPHVLLGPAAAFAPAQLAVVVQRLALLLSPGIVLAFAVRAAAPWRTPRDGAAPPDAGARVLLAAAVGALAHVLFLHAKIAPPVQDWDLFASALVPLALLAGRILSARTDGATVALAAGISASTLALGVLTGRAG